MKVPAHFLASQVDQQKAAPLGLFVLVLLGVACYFLFKSMSQHLRRVRDDFPAAGFPPTDGAARGGTARDGSVRDDNVRDGTAPDGTALDGTAPDVTARADAGLTRPAPVTLTRGRLGEPGATPQRVVQPGSIQPRLVQPRAVEPRVIAPRVIEPDAAVPGNGSRGDPPPNP